MKELNQEFKGDKIEITGQNEIQHSEVFVGTMKLQPNTFYWELNRATLIIQKAELEEERIELVEQVNIVIGRGTGKFDHVKRRDLITKDNHWYCVASNWRNAKKKFLKRIKNEHDKKILQDQKEKT